MFGGILRRVISNPDAMDEHYNDGAAAPASQDAADDGALYDDNASGDDDENNVVLIDTSQVSMTNDGQVPLTLIHSRSSGSAMSGSTLSEDDPHLQMDITNDDDAMVEDDANEEEEEQAPPRRIRRMDSEELSQRAMSSQNSSRDWGWFEDVHIAATQKPLAAKRKQRGESADDSVVQHLRETNPEGMM